VPCAKLSWPFRQLFSVGYVNIPSRIVSYWWYVRLFACLSSSARWHRAAPPQQPILLRLFLSVVFRAAVTDSPIRNLYASVAITVDTWTAKMRHSSTNDSINDTQYFSSSVAAHDRFVQIAYAAKLSSPRLAASTELQLWDFGRLSPPRTKCRRRRGRGAGRWDRGSRGNA